MSSTEDDYEICQLTSSEGCRSDHGCRMSDDGQSLSSCPDSPLPDTSTFESSSEYEVISDSEGSISDIIQDQNQKSRPVVQEFGDTLANTSEFKYSIENLDKGWLEETFESSYLNDVTQHTGLRTETRTLRTWDNPESWHNRFNLSTYALPTILSPRTNRPGTYVIHSWNPSATPETDPTNSQPLKSRSDEIANSSRNLQKPHRRTVSSNRGVERRFKGNSVPVNAILKNGADTDTNCLTDTYVVPNNARANVVPNGPAAFLRFLKAKKVKKDNLLLHERIQNVKPSNRILNAFSGKS